MSPRKRRVVRIADLSTRIDRVADEILRRRLAGERISDDVVIRQHLDLMPELDERLKALKLVEKAERVARAARARKNAAPKRRKPSKPKDRYVQGRCPYCKAPYRISIELAAKKIRCPRCRGVFVRNEFAAAVRPPHWPDENHHRHDAQQG